MVNLPKLWDRLTLRTRTAIILTAFIWTTALVVSIVCRVSIQALMIQRTDAELLDDLGDFEQILNGHDWTFSEQETASWNRLAAIHPLQHLFVRIYDDHDETLWESITSPQPSLRMGVLKPNQFYDFANYRIVARPIVLKKREVLQSDDPGIADRETFVQVGCSLDPITSSILYVEWWLVSIFGVLILVGPLISMLLAKGLLEPLRSLAFETDSLRVESEEDLLRLSGSGDELDRLSETINSLLKRVRSHLQENEDWIANSAHQLRSPLAAIMSNVEVVQGRLPDGKLSEMLDRVLNECGYLNKLVNQLLLLGEAKADRSCPNRTLVQWDELVRRSSDFFEALANANDIEIVFSKLEPCKILANSEHLRFVIHNVIDNAIKYTHAGGKVDVSIEVDRDRRICFLRVRDTGIGISERDLERVGNRFFRSDSGRNPENTPRGTGLGLSIVKTIVESLQGTVEIESELGKGTEVRVILPIDREST